VKDLRTPKDFFHSLMHMGIIGASDSAAPSIDDAKPAYFAAANKIGLTITSFEKIAGQWEWENILYKMEVAVEGTKDKDVYKHTEIIRFHKTKSGWYIELPVFSICGIRKNEVSFKPIDLSNNLIY